MSNHITHPHRRIIIQATGVLLVTTLFLAITLLPYRLSAATLPYACGTFMAPDQATADAELQRRYAAWKNSYLTSSGAGGNLRIQRPGDGNDTVSEGIAYGMLLAAYTNDRATFDGLWRYAKSHLDANGLMHWRIDSNNTVIGYNAATDADQDMAFALIIADKVWGGYRSEAVTLIGRIMQFEVEPNTSVLKPGDAWGGSQVTNPSYFAPAFYKAFQSYTGDTRWANVVNASYRIISNVNNQTGAGTTGLQPDWVTAAGGPASGMGYNYTYDATRVPWRLAADAAWNCEPRATNQLAKLNGFFQRIGPANIRDGYRLDGSQIGQWHNAAFVAPAASGALLSGDQAYRSAMWKELLATPGNNYYNESLRVLSLLFVSGKMKPLSAFGSVPTATVVPPTPTSLSGGTSTTGVRVQYRAGNTNPTDNQIGPHLQVINGSSQSIPLAELTIRYWFTTGSSQTQNYWCDWAAVGCANLKPRIIRLATPVPAADSYLEIGFTGGTLAAGASTGPIQSRIAKSNWSAYDETRSYSFDPTKTTFTNWDRVTLHRNGILIWGRQP